MRNAVQRRPHRERAQPLERRRLGLLEKHKVCFFAPKLGGVASNANLILDRITLYEPKITARRRPNSSLCGKKPPTETKMSFTLA